MAHLGWKGSASFPHMSEAPAAVWLELPGMAKPASLHMASLSGRADGLLYMVSQGSQDRTQVSMLHET